MPAPLLLVDGHNLLYRAWFGFPARVVNRSTGRDLTGIFGFIALLRKAHLEKASGHEIVVVFDAETSAVPRQLRDPSYKQTRIVADHSPMKSYPDLLRVLDVADISWLEFPTAEADDVIATLTGTAVRDGRLVTILSADKDFYQLLDSDRVRILNTQRGRQNPYVTSSDVTDRFRVTPRQWPDYRALTGDPADNIPGIRGIGPKTAAALLGDGVDLDSLSGLLATHRRAAVRRAVGQWDALLRSRDLIRLVDELTLPGDTLSGTATPELPLTADLLHAVGLW